ncbi:MAG: LPXTG cell wall anchor domain-containing protein [Oscillospiraceae bacterium]|nr:LPXTG cell wall anchor domain-containing protein [Oscillospiraceae bacterium]
MKIRGLDNDKNYILTETETKDGYNLLNGTVTLTKVKDEGTAFADKAANTFDKVENNKGTTLPSTGGIGTTIFYVVGSILVVAAGVLLITKKRMSREG